MTRGRTRRKRTATTAARRVFLLSPADCAGRRARRLLAGESGSELAGELRDVGTIALGDAFALMSSLYFRGKRAYAESFASPPADVPGVWVITPTRGLLPIDARVDAATLAEFAAARVNPADPRYRGALQRSAADLAGALARDGLAVPLGSVATQKYVEPLAEVLGERLRFPAEFVGRGSLSRGALLLRCVQERRELEYVTR